MFQQRLSPAAVIILATLVSYTKASMFNSQPKFILKAENNKAFDNSALFKAFNMKSENIAECLEHCLQDCRCQSFQICQKTKCQLCSSHKKENSSLLHDNNSCVYAMYEIQEPSKTFQKLNNQCSDMSCSMKYDCCQQAGLCPRNKVCKPFNSLTESWKRFTCECRDGYYGENCDQPIRSCAGYLNVRRKWGKYKVVDSQNSEFDVYCHSDSDAVWTLVQSYSFANSSLEQFKKPLFNDTPINEDNPTWSGYRLRKSRMVSIRNVSTFMQFTCTYEKHRVINKSDYVQIYLQNITNSSGEKIVDIFQLDTGYKYTEQSRVTIKNVRGKIGNCDLSQSQIQLGQNKERSLHVHFSYSNPPKCDLKTIPRLWTYAYFGSYHHTTNQNHSCITKQNSTTQLWFGVPNP